MKLLVLNLAFILALGTPEAAKHTANSGSLNINALDQIENLIRKKAGAELEKNHENSFTLNGYNVFTGVTEHRFGPKVYEESFYEIKNPENVYRMRIVVEENGDREFAVLIHGNEGNINYHAVFDSNGVMLDEDPWGTYDGYTIEIFDLYKKYRKLYAEKVDSQK